MTRNTTEVPWSVTYENCVQEKTKRLTFFYLIFFAILSLNGLVVFVLSRRKLHRLSVCDTLILHLSLTDLIVSLSGTTQIIPSLVSSQAVSSVLCQIIQIVARTTYNCSLYFITTLAACRCYGVVKPFSYRAHIYPSRVNKICLGVWCFSFVSAFTPILGWGNYEPVKGQCRCALNSHKYLSKWLETVIIFYVIPMLINIVSFVSTAVTLVNKARKEAQKSRQITCSFKAISSASKQNLPSTTRKNFPASNTSAESSANKGTSELANTVAVHHMSPARNPRKNSIIQAVSGAIDSTATRKKHATEITIKVDVHHIQARPEEGSSCEGQSTKERKRYHETNPRLSNESTSSVWRVECNHKEEASEEKTTCESQSQKEKRSHETSTRLGGDMSTPSVWEAESNHKEKTLNERTPCESQSTKEKKSAQERANPIGNNESGPSAWRAETNLKEESPDDITSCKSQTPKETKRKTKHSAGKNPVRKNESDLSSGCLRVVQKMSKETVKNASQDQSPRKLFLPRESSCGLNSIEVQNPQYSAHLQEITLDEEQEDLVEHQSLSSSNKCDPHQPPMISFSNASHGRQIMAIQHRTSRSIKQPKFLVVGIFSLVNFVLYGISFIVKTKYAFAPQSVGEDIFAVSNFVTLSILFVNPFLYGLLSKEIRTDVKKLICG